MKKNYIRGFDGLRTLGVVFVILYHIFPNTVKGGYLGVVLFFCVSGYLITDLLIQEYKNNGTINIKSFYIRRIKRLYPGMILIILCTSFYCAIFQPAFLNHMRMVFVSSLFGFNNWWQIIKGSSYFTHLMADAPFSHFYSLAIEAQFYLIWPFICLILFKLKKKKSKIFLIIFVLSIISALEMAVLFKGGEDPTRIYYGTDTRAFSILIGSSFAFILPSTKLNQLKLIQKANVSLNRVFFMALFLVMLMFMFLPDQSWITYRGGMYIFSFLCCILIVLIASPRFKAGKIFSNRLFDYIGKRSYGIYLCQMPILTLVEVRLGHSMLYYIVSIALVLFYSELSYSFVEKPLRKMNYEQALKKECRKIVSRHKKKRGLNIFILSKFLLIVWVIACLGIVIFSPNRDMEQEKISAEIQENAKKLKKAKNKKLEISSDNKQEVERTDFSEFDNLASKYFVTSEQMYKASTEPIIAVGDSMFTKTYNNLSETFTNMVLDAEFGLAPEDSFSMIQNLVQQYPDVDTVFISIGTNMGGTTGILNQNDMDQIMTILKDKKVYWATINLPSSTYWWTDDINNLLEYNSTQYSNLTLVNWYDYSNSHVNDWFESDEFHPNEIGSVYYTKLWIDTLFPE